MRNTKVLSHLGKLLALMVPGLMIVAVLNEDARSSIRDSLQPEYRKLLSTAFGNALGDGTPIRVMKVKTRNGISLEIYKVRNYELIQKIDLYQPHDGFFTYKGHSTNLVLADVDGDDAPEILASSYDENLSAHLNVYRYDRDTHLFHRLINESELKLSNL